MSVIEHVRASATIAASAEALFDRVADYRSAQRLIDGLDSMSPTGAITVGIGAHFDAVMRVGPRRFASTIEITGYERPRRLTWSSSGEERQVLDFKFIPDDTSDKSGGTKVTLEVSYARPAGVSGSLLAPIVKQTVAAKVQSTLEAIRAGTVSAPRS